MLWSPYIAAGQGWHFLSAMLASTDRHPKHVCVFRANHFYRLSASRISPKVEKIALALCTVRTSDDLSLNPKLEA